MEVLALDCGCVAPGSGSGRGVTLKTAPQVHCVWRWVTLETRCVIAGAGFVKGVTGDCRYLTQVQSLGGGSRCGSMIPGARSGREVMLETVDM